MGAIFGGGGQSGANSLDDIKQKQLEQQQLANTQLQQVAPQQQQFADVLAQGALGKGPSIADAQMKLAMEQSLQQQLAAAQAQRGVNPALAGRNAQMAAAQTNLGISGQGAANRLQEQRNQQSAFQNYLGGQQNFALGTGNAAANTANAQTQQQNHQNAMLAGLIGTAGNLAGAAFTGGGSAAAGAGGGGSASKLGNQLMMSKGGMVPGPEVITGDHPANDVIPAALSSGEVVIPKSVVDKGGKAAGAFVDALKQHYELKEKIKKMSYGDVLAAKKGE